MELYLLRHGAAEERSLTGADRDRRLTAEGLAALHANLERAAADGTRPTVILSSPYARALETAAIAKDVLGYPGPVLRSVALEPDASPNDLWSEVRIHGDEPAVLVVSHEPLLSSTLWWMIGPENAPQGFSTGSMASLTIERPSATPRAVIRRLPGLLD